MAQTDPEYRARGPSSLPILIIAWSMPLYRISRYLLSPTWPWTWSRVLARSMGNVPGTETRRLFHRTEPDGGSDRSVASAGVCAHHSPHSAVTEASPPKTKGFQLRLDMSSSSPAPSHGESLPEPGERQAQRWQFTKIKSAAAVHFRSGRAAPAPLSCRPAATSPAHRKPRPRQYLKGLSSR